jgi:hypothetical protein
MKGSTRAAMALGVGYLLGRQRKLRTATVMAVATAAGGTNVGSLVMRRGAKMLVNSGVMDKVPPQVGDLVDVVRGDLLQAGKGAATAAVSSRIDSLTDSLHGRAERLRNPGEAAGKAAGGAVRTGRGAAGSATRRLRGRGSDDDVAADEVADEPVDEEQEPYSDEAADEDEDEYADDEYADDDYDEAEPADQPEEQDAPPRRRRARSPVSRTRR